MNRTRRPALAYRRRPAPAVLDIRDERHRLIKAVIHAASQCAATTPKDPR